MKEVSGKPISIMFDALTASGIPHDLLTSGQRHTLEFLKNQRNRIDWDDFLVLARNFGRLVAGPPGLEAAGADALEVFDRALAFIGYVTSSHRLYWAVEKWVVHAAFSPIVSSYRLLSDDRIEIIGEIADGFDDCEEFFWISKGSFRMIPRLIGQPEAHVEAEITPRKAVYTITPPPSLTIFARLGRVFKVAGAGKAALEELRFQQEQLSAGYQELQVAHDRIRESEERFRGLFETAFGGMLIHEDGVIVEANQGAALMLGYEPQEVVGRSVVDFLDETSKEEVGEKLSSDSDQAYEVSALRKDGQAVSLEVVSKAHELNGRSVRIAGLRDITERKKLEEEVIKAKKLESVGVLAGGIAHDFNNLLAVNLWNLDLAAGCVDESEAALRIDKAKGAALRAKELTDRLLTFALGGAPIKNPTSIKELIEESADFCVCGSNIDCQTAIPDDLWAAEADEGQIHQVLTNLIVNAAEAMPKGGVVKVWAENFVKEQGDKSLPLSTGEYVTIAVSDTGIGIPSDTLAKIFEPFFTTKETGSGLGLATAHSIVERHGGCIRAESKIGEGATFYVYLPSSKKEPVKYAQKDYTDLQGQGRILIVDDEAGITEAVGAALSSFGYDCESAPDGARAIQLYRTAQEEDNPIDVVVMDLTVKGGMGGKSAISELLKIDPNAKVIASSGYSNDEVAAEYARYGFTGFIAKPYDVMELAAMVGGLVAAEFSKSKH